MEVQNMKDADSEERNKMATLHERIEKLEAENKKIQEEFNVQRAKMKELFLQKEEEFSNEKCRLATEKQKLKEELDEVRSELLIAGMKLETDLEDEKRKAQEQIASLQQLVHETVEESSTSRTVYDSELRKLHNTVHELQEENKELKSLGQQSSPHHTVQESGSLAPSVMLSAVTKTLVRKLGADAFSTQDNLEESMRKAQEDAEVLRSLVVPLEEEIKALKDKLRSTDEQLQRCIHCCHNPSPVAPQQTTFPPQQILPPTAAVSSSEDRMSASPQPPEESTVVPGTTDSVTSPLSPVACDMCSNYEAQLVREQQQNTELGARLAAAEKTMERHKEDLLKEIGFRKDMEEKWNEKKEEHKQQVSELNKRTLCAEQDLREIREGFNEYMKMIEEQLNDLTRQREQVYERLKTLQGENDRLVGKHGVHSQKLQSETINLPDTVEELQEKLLKLQEDLIIAVVGKEVAQEQERTLQGDILLLRHQLDEREQLEQNLNANLDLMKKESQLFEKEKRHLIAVQEKMKQNEKAHQNQVASLGEQLLSTQLLMKQLEESNAELRSRVASLQQELDNSEQVQKDFVLLSQSLQVQLEKIRASDTQVRWQHEDDVDDCPGCRVPFSGAAGASGGSSGGRRSKHHCLHCGQVFCSGCLNRTVPSGPKRRPARVCDVCHTLLVKSSAPYFSTEPPHSPD